jgi:hypothetical protein
MRVFQTQESHYLFLGATAEWIIASTALQMP